MKNLFIIDGLAGTGKSDFLNFIQKTYSTNTNYAYVITKYSTRDKRKYEKNKFYQLDLEFITDEEFNKKVNTEDFLQYEYGDHRYGFSKLDLDNSIKKNRNTFIIIRNLGLIEYLIKSYSDINVIPIFIYSDNEFVKERLKKEGLSDEEINERMERSQLPLQDYLSYSVNLYKETIINNSSKDQFQAIILHLVNKYNIESPHYNIENTLIKPLIGYSKKINDKLKNCKYEKNVFLMIKYRDNNLAIIDAIKKTLSDNGFYCICANDNGWNLTNNVYNPMAVCYCCKYGIALFDEPEPETGQIFSPNVAYELGIMQSMEKDCLIIKHSAIEKSNFFDIVKDTGNIYSNYKELKDIITKWISEKTKRVI